MRISNTITVRRGKTYEIKSVSENGSMLLRPTTQVALKFESVARSVQTAQNAVETHETTRLAPRQIKACHGSRGEIGLRKQAKVDHFYDCRLYTYDFSRGHSSWKRHRATQYHRRDKRQELDPNPIHLDI